VSRAHRAYDLRSGGIKLSDLNLLAGGGGTRRKAARAT
jgi:hypothetical protein